MLTRLAGAPITDDIVDTTIDEKGRQVLSGKTSGPFVRWFRSVIDALNESRGSADVPYASGDFGATGGMTWGVSSGDVATMAKRVIGSWMLLQFYLGPTSVTAPLGNALLFTIPGGLVAVRTVLRPILIVDNVVRTSGYAIVVANSPYVQFTRTDAGNFSASVNATYVIGDIEFEVKEP